jgi:hypothetical protein
MCCKRVPVSDNDHPQRRRLCTEQESNNVVSIQLLNAMTTTGGDSIIRTGVEDHDNSLHQHQYRSQRHPKFARIFWDERLQQKNDYQRFAIFIKLLMKSLERDEKRNLVHQSMRIVKCCYDELEESEHQEDPNTSSVTSMSGITYTSRNFEILRDAIVDRLKDIIEPMYWNQTGDYLGYSYKKTELSRMM